MTCGVANGVRINFCRTDVVKKPFRKLPSNDGTCSGVMGVIDSIGTVLAIDIAKLISNLCEGVVPGNPFEFSASLFSRSFQRIQQTGVFIEPYSVVANSTFSAKWPSR